MVTQTMTNEEILREYYLDKKNVIDVLVKRQDKIGRAHV